MGDEQRKPTFRDVIQPLSTVLSYAAWTLGTLFFIYLGMNIWLAVVQMESRNSNDANQFAFAVEKIQFLSNRIEVISWYAWELFQPFIQLVLVMFIVDWILKRLGIDLFSK